VATDDRRHLLPRIRHKQPRRNAIPAIDEVVDAPPRIPAEFDLIDRLHLQVQRIVLDRADQIDQGALDFLAKLKCGNHLNDAAEDGPERHNVDHDGDR